MNTNFKLRAGTVSDFDDLYSIYMDKDINRFLGFAIMNKEDFRCIFNELLNSGHLYVYECDDQVIATCIVRRQKRRANHVASLSTLAIHTVYQGKGIGTMFMKELISELKENGIKRIDLYVEEDNPAAIAFYSKLGFQREGILKKYFIRETENHYVDEHLMALVFD